jgi:hypothetical protein
MDACDGFLLFNYFNIEFYNYEVVFFFKKKKIIYAPLCDILSWIVFDRCKLRILQCRMIQAA